MYQETADAYVFADFHVAAAISNDGWHLPVPSCLNIQGFPWTRYAIGWPSNLGNPREVNIGGLNQLNAFVLAVDDMGDPVTLGSEDDPIELYITARRIDCRAVQNTEWTAVSYTHLTLPTILLV